MNDFLNRIVLDNPIKNYLIVAGIILFILILKRFISRYIAGVIYGVVKKGESDAEKKSFAGLVAKPLGFFLLILITIICLHKLVFPTVLNVEVYKFTLKELISAIGTITLIISFIWLLLRLIDFIAIILGKKADLTPDHTDNQLIIFFKDFFKAVVSIMGVLLVFKFGFGFSISNFITGLSIATAAIALATRESLENLIASFIIFFDKPFTVGDIVQVNNLTGTVEKIGLRSTKVRSDQKTFVTVPNKQMVDSILDNLSLRSQRKAEIRLEVSVNVATPVLQQFVDAIKLKLNHLQIESSTVFLSDIRTNSFLIHIDYFTAPIALADFNKLKQQKNLEILQLMEEMKIELAGASNEIRVSGKLG